MEYLVKLSVVGPDGTEIFSYEVPAKKEDVYHLDAATPGLAPVVGFLTAVAGIRKHPAS